MSAHECASKIADLASRLCRAEEERDTLAKRLDEATGLLGRADRLLQACARGTNAHPFCPGCGKLRDTEHGSWCPMVKLLVDILTATLPREPEDDEHDLGVRDAVAQGVQSDAILRAAEKIRTAAREPRQERHAFVCSWTFFRQMAECDSRCHCATCGKPPGGEHLP